MSLRERGNKISEGRVGERLLVVVVVDLGVFRCINCVILCWRRVFRESHDWCDGGVREVRVKLKREK